jgi:peptide-methionine (R)-S-oxide reductase
MAKQINPNLTEEQKKVLFESGTEAPFSGKFYLSKAEGAYVCANCGNPLFKSDAKFDSDCGWPSFFKPYGEKSVTLTKDDSFGMSRTEVKCQKCGAHLGHVFDDVPQTPTGKWYCINSLSLDMKK